MPKRLAAPTQVAPPAARGRFVRPGLGERIRALTFFSQSNRPRRATVNTRVGLTLGTACPRHLASAIHPPPPPSGSPAGRGLFVPGTGASATPFDSKALHARASREIFPARLAARRRHRFRFPELVGTFFDLAGSDCALRSGSAVSLGAVLPRPLALTRSTAPQLRLDAFYERRLFAQPAQDSYQLRCGSAARELQVGRNQGVSSSRVALHAA